MKQGAWQVALKKEWTPACLFNSLSTLYPQLTFVLVKQNIPDILNAYQMATQLDPTWHKAWHTWALANFDVINFLETQDEAGIHNIPLRDLAGHVVAAIRGISIVVR